MPQKRNSQEPPEVMTWGRAMPVLVVAGIFDLTRLFFVLFWFFGPALAAVYCASTASEWVGSLWGLTAAACGVGAAAAGAAVSAFTIPFGTVMAMAVGLFGWLTIGIWLMRTNARIFKENALWFGASLLISEVPIIGSIPALSITVWKMYKTQIRIEKVAFKKLGKEHADEERKRRDRQAANDDLYIPQKTEEAA